MARNTKLNADVTAKICEALRQGATREDAARSAGIGHSAFFAWMAAAERQVRGRTPSPRYLEFSDAIKRAESDFAVEAAAHIRKVSFGGELISRETTTRRNGDMVEKETYAPPEWTAMAWLLERKWPQLWGRHDRLSVEVQQAFTQQQEAIRMLFGKLDEMLLPEQKDALTSFMTNAKPIEALPLAPQR